MPSLTTLTHFKCFVEDAKAPCALSATLNYFNAELIFCVGSEVVDMNIQVGRVHHLLATASRAAAGATTQLVLDCVYAIVVDTLAPTETCVRPHYDYCCC